MTTVSTLERNESGNEQVEKLMAELEDILLEYEVDVELSMDHREQKVNKTIDGSQITMKTVYADDGQTDLYLVIGNNFGSVEFSGTASGKGRKRKVTIGAIEVHSQVTIGLKEEWQPVTMYDETLGDLEVQNLLLTDEMMTSVLDKTRKLIANSDNEKDEKVKHNETEVFENQRAIIRTALQTIVGNILK